MNALHTPTTRERLRGALWGMFVGDALAMPVHWYYDLAAWSACRPSYSPRCIRATVRKQRWRLMQMR